MQANLNSHVKIRLYGTGIPIAIKIRRINVQCSATEAIHVQYSTTDAIHVQYSTTDAIHAQYSTTDGNIIWYTNSEKKIRC